MADSWMLKAVISANSAGMLKALKEVNSAAKASRKYLGDIGSSAGKLGTHVGLPLGLISGALSAFTVAGVKQAVMSFAKLGDEVHKSAQRLSMSTDEYQRLKYMAGQSGVDVEALGSSIGRLNKSIGMAGAGKNKELASLLKHAGIAMHDANGQLRSGAELLPEVADLFARNTNATTQARIGNALFGKSWQTLAPLLAGGKEGIEQLSARFKKLNLLVSEDALIAAEAFGDQVEDLNLVLNSYGYSISAKLIPVLSPMIERTIEWAVANKDLISTKVSDFLLGIAKSLEQVDWKSFAESVKSAVDGVKKFVDMCGGTRNALIALAVVMNIQTIGAIVGLIGSFGRAGWAMGAFAVKAVPKVLAAFGLIEGEAIAASVATDTLTASTKAADAAGVTLGTRLKGLAGMAGTLAAAVAPLAAMWGVKEWAEDKSHDTERVQSIQQNVSSPLTKMLGWFGFDKQADIEARRRANRAELGGEEPVVASPTASVGVPGGPGVVNRPSLIQPRSSRVDGKLVVDFQNAPPGMRVTEKTSSGPELDTQVGYRSFAYGAP